MARRSRYFVVRPRSRSRGGMRRAELHQAAIEERHARLERVRHAHAVDLHQNVGRQVELRVDVLQAVELAAVGLGVQRLEEAHRRLARRARPPSRVERGLRVLVEDRLPPEVPGGRRQVRAGDEALRLVVEADFARATPAGVAPPPARAGRRSRAAGARTAPRSGARGTSRSRRAPRRRPRPRARPSRAGARARRRSRPGSPTSRRTARRSGAPASAAA